MVINIQLARHVLGNNFAHLQELLTVQYSLWYVVPNTLPVGDLVTEEIRHQFIESQRIGYDITQAVLHSQAPEDGQNVCQKHVELNWIYQ